MDAQAIDPLEVPEGLAQPDRTRQLTIPAAADVVHPELRGTRVMGANGRLHCLESPPPRTPRG